MNYVVLYNVRNRYYRNGSKGVDRLMTLLLLLTLCMPMPTMRHDKGVHNHAKRIYNKKTNNAVNKDALLRAFIYVESKGVNDTINKSSGAVGCLQIMPILIDEANRLLRCNKYTLSDRTNRRKSVEIFHLMMKHKNPSYDIAKACKIWHPNGRQSYTDSVKQKYNELIKIK